MATKLGAVARLTVDGREIEATTLTIEHRISDGLIQPALVIADGVTYAGQIQARADDNGTLTHVDVKTTPERYENVWPVAYHTPPHLAPDAPPYWKNAEYQRDARRHAWQMFEQPG